MKELALLPGEGKDWNEGQHDNGHREEDGATHQPGGVEHRGRHGTAVMGVHPTLLDERNAFSVPTMAASTSTPMAIAMPARDMMLEVIPR